MAGARSIEHVDFQSRAVWQRLKKPDGIVAVTGCLSICGRNPLQSGEGLVVDLIVDLNCAGSRCAPCSLRAKQDFGARSKTSNDQRVWCVLQAGCRANHRRDERAIIHRRRCFTYDPMCILWHCRDIDVPRGYARRGGTSRHLRRDGCNGRFCRSCCGRYLFRAGGFAFGHGSNWPLR